MKLSEVTELIESTSALLNKLEPGAGDRVAAGLDIVKDVDGVVTDAQADLLEANTQKARSIVSALSEEVRVTTEERTAFANDQIASLEAAIASADGTEKIILNGKLRQAKINKAALVAAAVFQGFVVFTPEEREEINKLMAAAEKDLANRKKLAAAIGIAVNVMKTGLGVAKKMATFGT